MKQFKYILGVLALVSIIGCDNYDVEPVIDESAKPTVTATAMDSSISEAGSPITTVTINMDKPIKTTTTFTAIKVGGDATEDDFEVENAVIPAYQTSTTMEITIKDDFIAEGTESIQLQITPSDVPDLYEVLGTPTVTFSIENSISFSAELDWDGSYMDASGGDHSFCDYDLDLELYSADFNDLYYASYSHCPEDYVVGQGELEDGDYWIVPSFWTNNGPTEPASPENIPAMLHFGVLGSNTESVTIDLSTVWDTQTGGYLQGNPDAYLVKYVLTVSGNSYTVTDADSGSVVFEN
ncbi:hypothetical protein [Aestuariivivens sediminis]|uniref:hypothetical protein n=1 Tax=Aestuariivivens sediminis TaxID=2913557 RepID=UPI001F579A3E|nr:hypothetical protein [Aestuariivivens sediminis]